MVDLSTTIIAKSDQMNAIDLVGGSTTITITAVERNKDATQPISIQYKGGEGRPYKPCLTMRRLLVLAWGKDGQAYVGRQLTLYNDPDVIWAGRKEGGIRISHMSHIDKPFEVMLPEKRGQKKAYSIQAVGVAETPVAQDDPAERWAHAFTDRIGKIANKGGLVSFLSSKRTKLGELESARPELHQRCMDEVAAKEAQLSDGPTASAEDEF